VGIQYTLYQVHLELVPETQQESPIPCTFAQEPLWTGVETSEASPGLAHHPWTLEDMAQLVCRSGYDVSQSVLQLSQSCCALMGVWPHIEELVDDPNGDEFEGREEVYKVNKPGNTLLQVPNAHGHDLEAKAQAC
jgi:hypothetical protein